MPDDRKTCAEEITIRVKDGTYPPGEWLPSLQKIADDLGVSRGTVERTLPVLAAEGVITHVKGSGYHPGERPDHVPRRRRRTAAQRRYESGRSEVEISALLNDPYVTVIDVAKFLRVSKMTVYRAAKAGRIPGVVRITERTIRLPSEGVRVFLRDSSVCYPIDERRG